jgi:hypothetical protein
MAKIYIDTNVFIDFYQAAKDPLAIFDELSRYTQYLVFTTQTLNEFQRNRVTVLKWLIKEFKKSVTVNPFTTSILREADHHKELIKIRDEFNSKAKDVSNYLTEMMADIEKDPVAKKFFSIVNAPDVTKFEITEDLTQKAFQRKLLGNPPTSSDKYTVGDEVIWEVIIRNLQDDLIIVSRDHTYSENIFLLKSEFQSLTGKTILLISDKISEALTKVGEAPSEKLIEEEEKIMDELDDDDRMGRRVFGKEYLMIQEGLKNLRDRVSQKQSEVNDKKPSLGIPASAYADLDDTLQTINGMIEYFEEKGFNSFGIEFVVTPSRKTLTLLKTAAALLVEEYEQKKEEFLQSESSVKKDLLFEVEQELQKRRAVLNDENLSGVEPDRRFLKA